MWAPLKGKMPLDIVATNGYNSHVENFNKFRMDKSTLAIGDFRAPSDESTYWARRSPHERLAGLELNRQIIYAYDPATTRFQRFLEIAEFPRR